MTRTEAVNQTTGGAGRAVVVFTDLDGTLMDHDSYDVAPAQAALEALAARSIPVVPVTSKTRTELEPLMARLGLSGPAIAENGAVIMNTDGSPDTADAREKIALALDALNWVLGEGTAFSRRASSSSFFAVSAAPGACWTESGAMPEILGMCGRDVEAWKAIPEGIVRSAQL